MPFPPSVRDGTRPSALIRAVETAGGLCCGMCLLLRGPGGDGPRPTQNQQCSRGGREGAGPEEAPPSTALDLLPDPSLAWRPGHDGDGSGTGLSGSCWDNAK